MSEKKQASWVTWDYDRKMYVYRTFCIGECLLSLVAARLGETPAPPPAWLRAIFDKSASTEADAIKAYELKTGHKTTGHQMRGEMKLGLSIEMDETVENVQTMIVCHIDALDPVDDVVLEVKSFGTNYFNLYREGGLDALPSGLGEKYRWQMAVQGHAFNKPVRNVIFWKNAPDDADLDDLLIIGEANHADNIVPAEHIAARIGEVERYALMDEYPPCDMKCRPGTAFDHIHAFEGVPEAGEELEELCNQYQQIRDLLGDEKDMDGEGLLPKLERLKHTIKESFGNEKKMTAGRFVVRVTSSPGKPYVDGKWLKAHHPEIYEEALRFGKPYKSLFVEDTSRKKGKRDE